MKPGVAASSFAIFRAIKGVSVEYEHEKPVIYVDQAVVLEHFLTQWFEKAMILDPVLRKKELDAFYARYVIVLDGSIQVVLEKKLANHHSQAMDPMQTLQSILLCSEIVFQHCEHFSEDFLISQVHQYGHYLFKFFDVIRQYPTIPLGEGFRWEAVLSNLDVLQKSVDVITDIYRTALAKQLTFDVRPWEEYASPSEDKLISYTHVSKGYVKKESKSLLITVLLMVDINLFAFQTFQKLHNSAFAGQWYRRACQIFSWVTEEKQAAIWENISSEEYCNAKSEMAWNILSMLYHENRVVLGVSPSLACLQIFIKSWKNGHYYPQEALLEKIAFVDRQYTPQEWLQKITTALSEGQMPFFCCPYLIVQTCAVLHEFFLKKCLTFAEYVGIQRGIEEWNRFLQSTEEDNVLCAIYREYWHVMQEKFNEIRPPAQPAEDLRKKKRKAKKQAQKKQRQIAQQHIHPKCKPALRIEEEAPAIVATDHAQDIIPAVTQSTACTTAKMRNQRRKERHKARVESRQCEEEKAEIKSVPYKAPEPCVRIFNTPVLGSACPKEVLPKMLETPDMLAEALEEKLVITPKCHSLYSDRAAYEVVLSDDEHAMYWKKVPDNVKVFMAKVSNAGKRVYIVGGAVRDMLLGLRPGDFDMIVELTADVIECWPEVFKDPYIDGLYHFKDLAEYPVDLVIKSEGFDLQEDACNRDARVNGLYYCEHGLLDPLKAYAELIDTQASIKMIGDPMVLMERDPKTILRMIYLKNRLGRSLSEDISSAIMQQAVRLNQLPLCVLAKLIEKMLSPMVGANNLDDLIAYRLVHCIFPNISTGIYAMWREDKTVKKFFYDYVSVQSLKRLESLAALLTLGVIENLWHSPLLAPAVVIQKHICDLLEGYQKKGLLMYENNITYQEGLRAQCEKIHQQYVMARWQACILYAGPATVPYVPAYQWQQTRSSSHYPVSVPLLQPWHSGSRLPFQ